ncbi:MAG: type I secretion system permease/ATPase [Rickettsiales bacterium]|nr:type I secretion system permease/ATPase [Rickettsiales bacterium]
MAEAQQDTELSPEIKDAFVALKKPIFSLLIFSLFSNLLILIVPLYTLQVLDRVISSGSLATLLFMSIIAVVCLLTWGAIQSMRSLIATRTGRWVRYEMAPQVFGGTIEHSRAHSSMEGVRLQQTLQQLEQFMAFSLNTMLDAPWAMIFMAILFMIHPLIGSIALFGGLLLLALAILNHRMTRDVFKEGQGHFQKSQRFIGNSDQAMETAYVMGMRESLLSRWREIAVPSYDKNCTGNERNLVLGHVTKTIRYTLQIGVMGTGTYLALENEMTMGAIIAGSILMGKALQPFDAALNLWKSVLQVSEGVKSLDTFMKEAPKAKQGLPLPKPASNMEVRGVFYIPKGGKDPILDNITFSLPEASTLAVIGSSGAGKTTLSKVLVGYLPLTAGYVRLGGADIHQMDRNYAGPYFGYLSQDVGFIQGTVADNIARMTTDYDPAKVVEAAQFAEAHDTILHLPMGYDTPVLDYPLSAGQKQRVALARAFYNMPSLVVMDEPNANLDLHGDRDLNKTLVKAREAGITTIIISHRSGALKHASHVLIVKSGRLVEFGTREEILPKLQGKAKAASS